MRSWCATTSSRPAGPVLGELREDLRAVLRVLLHQGELLVRETGDRTGNVFSS
jgi:hypothetical protein